MKYLKTTILLCVLSALVVTCERDRLPTGTESGDITGKLVILLVKDSLDTATNAQKMNSISSAVIKAKVKAPAQLSAVSSLLVRVLDSSGGEITINPNTFTAQNGFFDATIEVKAQSGMTVLCIGKNSSGAVERFVMISGVSVVAGRTNTVSISESAWTAGFVPQLTGISPNPSSTGSYRVSWNSLSGAENYILQEATSSGFSGAATAYSGSGTYADITGKGPGTYYYRVQATNSRGVASVWSNSQSVVVSLAAPVLADPGTSVYSMQNYTVSWGKVSGATSYTIEKATNNTFTGAASVTISDTARVYGDTVSASTTYYYRVRANSGTGSGGWSSTVDIVVNPFGVPVVTDPGTSINSGGSYTVSWGSVTGAISYTIEEATNNGFTGATSKTVTGTSQQYSHTVSSNTTYFYRLKANYGASSSGWSNTVDMVVSYIGTPTLTDPGSSVVSGQNYTLVWSSVTGATSYTIEEATNSSFTGAVSQNVSGTSQLFSHSVTSSTTYYYRVRTNTSSGSGGWSNTVDMVVSPYSAPVVTDPGSNVNSGASYTVSWGSVSGAASYTIEEATNNSFTGASSQTVTGTSQQYSHTVSSTTTFYYRVKANYSTGSGGWSNTVDMVVSYIGTPTLTDPGSSVVSGQNYTVSWTSVSVAVSYTIEEASNNSFSGASSQNVTATSASLSHSVSVATTYYYRVKANNQYGSGGWSNTADMAVNPIAQPSNVEMVSIPGGTFQMGQVGVVEPVHQVTLSAFQIGRYEITQAQYQAVIGSNPSNFTGDDNRPVERVSWFDAATYCNKLSEATGLQPCFNLTAWTCDFTKNGYRLPTEAEWEYACRAGTTTNYYTGDSEGDLDRAGWYDGNSGGTTHHVGQKEYNAFGLYDMHGNVWELCNDWFGDYSGGNENDPQGPLSGWGRRVMRGGGWDLYGVLNCRSSSRGHIDPGSGSNNMGFRVVRGSFVPGGSTPPEIPILNDLGSSVTSGQSYTVSWGSVSRAISYTIEEATNSSFTGATSQNATGTSVSYSHSVSSATTYYYQIKANNQYGSSGWSNTVYVVVNPIAPSSTVEMVSISGGTFQMGQVGVWDAIPVHQVTVSTFQMSAKEITNAQYAAYLNTALAAGEITATTSSATGAKGDYSGQMYIWLIRVYGFENKCWISYNGTSFSVATGKENWPVVYVTWYGAKAFAVKYGFDLPREGEWEYASRGGKGYEYGTDDGTISSAKANNNRNVGYPNDVGSFPVNPFGLYDLAGNVEEWCSDWYGNYSSSSQTDPVGPSSGSYRVLRGGSFDTSDGCRSASRYSYVPYYESYFIGFRVVRR